MASHCPTRQHCKEMPEFHPHSLELFTYSPSLELLDEHQEMRFKYNTQKSVPRLATTPAGNPGSCKTWLLEYPSLALSDCITLPQSLPSACCQTPWSISILTSMHLHVPTSKMLPGNTLLSSYLNDLLPLSTLHGSAQVPHCLPMKLPQALPGLPRK